MPNSTFAPMRNKGSWLSEKRPATPPPDVQALLEEADKYVWRDKRLAVTLEMVLIDKLAAALRAATGANPNARP